MEIISKYLTLLLIFHPCTDNVVSFHSFHCMSPILCVQFSYAQCKITLVIGKVFKTGCPEKSQQLETLGDHMRTTNLANVDCSSDFRILMCPYFNNKSVPIVLNLTINFGKYSVTAALKYQ